MSPEEEPFQAVPLIGPQPLENRDPWSIPDESPPLKAEPDAAPPDWGSKPGIRSIFENRGAPIPPDYWIISSRDCPQSGSPGQADKFTKYYYRGPSGKVELRTAADFHRSLRPEIPVCMMVHGSLIEWEQNIREGHDTYEWLKRAAPDAPFQFVLFTWPSERLVTLLPPLDFSLLGYQSSFNGLYLARALSRMPPTTSVSVIGHSHGARLTISALHVLGGGEVYGYRFKARGGEIPRIRTVLAAAAVDHHWLDPGQRYGLALRSCESLLNLRNQTDLALILYPFPMLLGHDSLGRGGFTWFDERKLGSEFGKVRNVEVTFMLGLRHIWPRFHDHHEIAETLAPYVFFLDDVPPHSTVTHRRKPTPQLQQAREAPPRMLVQPGSRKSANGTSTLVRGTSNQAVRRSVDQADEVILEPTSGRVKLAPATTRAYPRSKANP